MEDNTKDEYQTDHDEIESDEAIENIKRLEVIKNKISELLDEIRQIVKIYPVVYQRADAYWLAHIECALSKDSNYVGSSMVTMDDTINEITKIEDKKKQKKGNYDKWALLSSNLKVSKLRSCADGCCLER